MAKKLYFDIETIPASEASQKALAYIYEKKKKKFEDAREDDTDEYMSFEEYTDGTGLDGAFGRILCIGYALDDKPTGCLVEPGNEAKMLRDFWDLAADVDLFIGHNIMEFDLKFIIQRSIILGVKPSWNKYEEPGKKPWEMGKFLSFARYRNCPIFDTMHEWNNWGRSTGGSNLEHIALAMGIPTPKEGIDGSQVWNFYKAGKIKEIADYCERDVETTRAVYKRMTFDSLPARETLPF